MTVVALRGRGLVGGSCEGEAFATRQSISGWGGIDPTTGRIIERRHESVGQSFAGKILVFPGAKGSSGWSGMFHMARLAGTAPIGLVFNRMNTKIALGAVVLRAPAITELDHDPLEVIESGDWLRLDADAGVLEITKAQDRAGSVDVVSPGQV